MPDIAIGGTLGDFVRLQRGTTYKSALLGGNGPWLLGLACIARNGGFKADNLKTYGGPSDAKILVGPGDVLVSLKDVTQAADLLGSVVKVPRFIRQGRLTQDTVKLVFNSSREAQQYIYWLLRTPQARAHCRQHATGTTNLGLARDDFLALSVPPLDSYRAGLLTLLQDLDDKIELNRRMNETLEAQARALFRDWFVDFGPVKAKIAGAAPYLTPSLWSLFPDRLDDDGVPEGWTIGSLERVASLNPETWSAKSHPSTIEYVDLANTKWGTIENTVSYNWADAPSRARRVLRAGDTIVGTVRPGNGSFAFVGVNGMTGSTGFAVLRPRTPQDRSYTWCAATDPENIDRLAHLADGGAYPAVRPELVSNTEAVFADDKVRDAFEESVGVLLDRIEHSKLESKTLAQTRDLLLPKLMSGEIRVGDVEHELASA